MGIYINNSQTFLNMDMLLTFFVRFEGHVVPRVFFYKISDVLAKVDRYLLNYFVLSLCLIL